MTLNFVEQAVREQVFLRAFLLGPTGAGKSLAALTMAALLDPDGHTTLINTERGREKLYADRFRYSLIDLTDDGDYAPQVYCEALDIAESRNPGGKIILDSVSHEWMGTGGILQKADRFGEWKTVRPMHNEFVDRLLQVQGHVIVTCRAKMKYGVEEEDVPGRSKPRQRVTMLGVGPIQSDDLQYEFNLVGSFERETHDVTFSGHVDPLIDQTFNFATDAEKVAEQLSGWLSDGTPQAAPPEADPVEVKKLVDSLIAEDYTQEQIDERFGIAKRQNRGRLHPDYVADNLSKSQTRLAAKQPQPAPAAAAAETATEQQQIA